MQIILIAFQYIMNSPHKNPLLFGFGRHGLPITAWTAQFTHSGGGHSNSYQSNMQQSRSQEPPRRSAKMASHEQMFISLSGECVSTLSLWLTTHLHYRVLVSYDLLLSHLTPLFYKNVFNYRRVSQSNKLAEGYGVPRGTGEDNASDIGEFVVK